MKNSLKSKTRQGLNVRNFFNKRNEMINLPSGKSFGMNTPNDPITQSDMIRKNKNQRIKKNSESTRQDRLITHLRDEVLKF